MDNFWTSISNEEVCNDCIMKFIGKGLIFRFILYNWETKKIYNWKNGWACDKVVTWHYTDEII